VDYGKGEALAAGWDYSTQYWIGYISVVSMGGYETLEIIVLNLEIGIISGSFVENQAEKYTVCAQSY
jgi:hypothetical protein